LASLRSARQVFLSLPEELGVALGDFDLAAVEREARAKGLRPESIRGVPVFSAPAEPQDSVALPNRGLLLVGPRAEVTRAIERALDSSRATTPVLPLFVRAQELSRDWDFFIAADHLDESAREFLPESPALSRQDLESLVAMDAGFRIRLGIAMKAVMTARTEQDAERLTSQMRPDAQAAQFGKASVTRQGRVVTADIDIDFKALMEGMAKAMAEGLKQGFEEMGKEMQPGGSRRRAGAVPRPPAVAASPTPAPSPQPELPPEKRVARIYGLDEGPREIPLTKPGEAKPASPPPQR
jgi:hypothetical protein